ncbi:FecCD family ABC transporter permease [Corynebacterium liangguodongii]|uniref:ABC transporter permease n=1 Tax=Corynebacterium liangguodongii TaxID=2079535 RepID=A0A2S0WF42_9CORY|nr:iron ABC transporter permease [Corynebacterium liangguodongii]AWB84282.1 ABC transporter permease [Corynebacterium liangguodongii]PWC00291.1 iron ABC transporter permease [Corynebacterium liangguodongii]
MGDTLGLRRARTRALGWLAVAATASVAVCVIAVAIGPTVVPPSVAAEVIARHIKGAPIPENLATYSSVVWDIRLPRVLLGATVGAGLAVAGVVLQAVVANVLADPYILGINAGASTGAACAILFGVGAGVFGALALQAMAFFGAVAASVLMLALARGGGGLSAARLLMGGVAVGYALSALTSLLVFASDNAQGARSVMFWLLGSLAMASRGPVLWATIAVVCACCLALWVLGTRIDALTLGDDTARTLGVNPDRARLLLVVVCCLVVGAVVSVAGSIGFVGLVVPHIARRLVGGLHRRVLPLAAALGASLTVAADVASRTLLAPQEIPIGVLTALVGAPLLVVLVARSGEKL